VKPPRVTDASREPGRVLLCTIILQQDRTALPSSPFDQYSAYFLIILAGVAIALLIYNYILHSKVRALSSQLHESTAKHKKVIPLNHEREIESLARLASPLAHDLNNTVGSIMGYAALLKKKLLPDTKEFHYAEIIENSSRRTLELVKQELGFSQLDTKTIEVVDLTQFVKSAAEYFVNTRGEKKHNVTVSPEFKPAKVQISTSQLRQVILAVLDNAADSMADGGVINCSIGFPEKSGPKVDSPDRQSECYVEVEDRGTGMDEEIRQRVFEPFFTTKKREKYTGLSLSQAFNIVKKHSGYISIASSPGVGTKVRVYLPLLDNTNASVIEGASIQAPEKRDAKILVVDDEESVRQLGFDILTEHNFNVITATNGIDALNKLKENPDTRLVVMDMIMPSMSGKEACIEIKKMENPPKILICTGFSELSDLKTILGTYAERMIQKPYSTGELVSAVEDLLNDTPTRKK
jgi:signal transduction histidine kinase/CheY-like chemotaxis protein